MAPPASPPTTTTSTPPTEQAVRATGEDSGRPATGVELHGTSDESAPAPGVQTSKGGLPAPECNDAPAEGKEKASAQAGENSAGMHEQQVEALEARAEMAEQIASDLLVRERQQQNELVMARRAALSAAFSGAPIPIRYVGQVRTWKGATDSDLVRMEELIGQAPALFKVVETTGDGTAQSKEGAWELDEDHPALKQVEAELGREALAMFIDAYHERLKYNPSGMYVEAMPWHPTEQRPLLLYEIIDLLGIVGARQTPYSFDRFRADRQD